MSRMFDTSRFRALVPCLAFLVTLLVAGDALAQDWKGRGRVRGSVTDTNNEPIKDAQIVILFRGQEGVGPEVVTSDKKGRWAYMGLASGPYTIRASADGYVPSEGQVNVNEYSPMAMQPLEIQLRKLEATDTGSKEGDRLMGLIEEGNAKMRSGDWTGARTAFEEVRAAVKEEKQIAQLDMAIAQTYLEDGQAAEARTRFQALLPPAEEDPSLRVSMLQQIARSYYMEDNIDQSVATLDEALQIEPENTQVVRRIIDILVAAGREADAEPYMGRLPEGEKVDANALLNLGITAYNNNDLVTAEEKFNNVLVDYPDNPDAHYYLGLVYMGQGKTAEAKASLEKMLELAPDHRLAGEAKEFLSYL